MDGDQNVDEVINEEENSDFDDSDSDDSIFSDGSSVDRWWGLYSIKQEKKRHNIVVCKHFIIKKYHENSTRYLCIFYNLKDQPKIKRKRGPMKLSSVFIMRLDERPGLYLNHELAVGL